MPIRTTISRRAFKHADSAGAFATELPWRHVSLPVLRQLPAYIVRSERVVPVALEGEVLVVALEDPADSSLRERISFIVARPLRTLVAPAEAIDRAIERFYPRQNEEAEEEPTGFDFAAT